MEVLRIPKGFKRQLHKTKRYKDRRVPKTLNNLKDRSGPGRTDGQRVQDEWRTAQHKLFWRMVVQQSGLVRCSLRDARTDLRQKNNPVRSQERSFAQTFAESMSILRKLWFCLGLCIWLWQIFLCISASLAPLVSHCIIEAHANMMPPGAHTCRTTAPKLCEWPSWWRLSLAYVGCVHSPLIFLERLTIPLICIPIDKILFHFIDFLHRSARRGCVTSFIHKS